MSDRDTLFEVIDGFDACILTTFTADGTPHGRPMHVARRDDQTLWFVTGSDTAKAEETARDSTVILTFQSSNKWVAATGRARVDASDGRVADLWSEPMRAWFPDGPEDPTAVAMAVELESAEYWSMSTGDMATFAWGVARSIITRQPITTEHEGEHGDVRL